MSAPPILARLEALERARPQSNGWWSAPCPAHEDQHASFGWQPVTGTDGRATVVLNCQAGCPNENIVGALGLEMRDLYAPRNGDAGDPRPSVIRTTHHEIRDGAGDLVAYHDRYDRSDGSKSFSWRSADGNKGLGGRPVTSLPLYGSDLVGGWPIESGIVIVEGEKSADALRAAGRKALGTVTGADVKGKAPDAAALEVLRGRRVVLWPDADAPGRAHMLALAERLAPIAASVQWLDPPPESPKGWDAADALGLSEDHASVLEQLYRRVGPVPGTTPALPAFPEPEDRGHAVRSPLGEVEYVEDLIRPGRIVVVSGEEGTGKSYAVGGELCIRMGTCGGAFAGTWPILRTGPVLVLSEMHGDDDFDREETVLASLGLDRAALAGAYYRLPLMTAAGDRPALMVPEWRAWVTGWMRDHGILLLVVDTATGATQVKPWGEEIQQVYRDLRLMLSELPDLAVALLLHMRKPSGVGDRRLSDVLGEWGRWCDVVLMMENDGPSLERVKLTARKRVRAERRIVATKRGGLLVDPVDADATGPKVPTADVMAAIVAEPGITYVELASRLSVSKATAARYVKALGEAVVESPTGPRGQVRVYVTASPHHTASRAGDVDGDTDRTDDRITAARTYIGAAVNAEAVAQDEADDYPRSAWEAA